MTKEEFIDYYFRDCAPAEKAAYLTEMSPMPCACGESACKGWAMVSHHHLSVKAHKELYAPDPEEEITYCSCPVAYRVNQEGCCDNCGNPSLL